MTTKMCLFKVFLFFIPSWLVAQNPTLVWAKTFGGSSTESAYSVVVTKDNKYLVAGLSRSYNGDLDSMRYPSSDVWLLKLDENGNLLWKKTYGGSGAEGMYAIVQTLDNGFIMVGSTTSVDGDVTVNKGNSDGWVIKIDSVGTIQWQKTIGGSDKDYFLSVFQTQNGDYIVGGYSQSSDKDFPQNSGKNDMWVLKLDSRGNIVWKKRIGGSDDDYLSQLTNIDDKTFAIAARTQSTDGDMVGAFGDFSVKMDSSGNIVWKKSFEGLGLKEFYGATMSQKNIVFVGMQIVDRTLPQLAYSWDFLVTKSDTAGNRLWSKIFGGSKADYTHSVQSLPNGDLLITGVTQSNDFDITGNHGDLDFWVIRIDSLGNLKNASCYGGSNEDQSFGSAIDKQGNLILVGFATSSNGTFTQNKGTYDLAVIKLRYDLVSTAESSSDADILIYPNPVEDALNIKIPPLSIAPIFRLYDITGKLMYQSEKGQNIETIDMHTFPKGFYILTYQLGSTYHAQKISKL